MEDVKVTNHAQKRFKQRLGLPKTACRKHAQLAYDKGSKHSDAKGKAKRYMDKIFLDHHNANQMRIYGEFIYLFDKTTLITVMAIPHGIKKGGFC